MTAFLLELVKTPGFYTALLALVHAILFYLAPEFPREIVVAADALVAVMASVYTGKAVEAKRSAAQIAALEARLRTMAATVTK